MTPLNDNDNRQTTAGKMLVVRLSALGDVAMTLPVVYSLANKYPDLDITFLTRPFFAKLFIGAPANLHIMPVDFKQDFRGLKGMMHLISMLRSKRFDYVADLHNVSRSWMIDTALRLSGAKVAMVDKKRSERRKMIKHKVDMESFISRYCNVFDRLGFPVDTDFKSIFQGCTPAAPIAVEHPAVGIAPFARYETKIYPGALMQLAAMSLAERGIHVYFFGGRGQECEQLQKWADAIPGATNVAGKFAIADELALMANMDVMVSMDSANQHMASLVDTPVVSIWGGTTPAAGFMAYGQDADNAICLNLECQPCSVAGTKACPLGTLTCMKGISPTQIADKVTDIILKKQETK